MKYNTIAKSLILIPTFGLMMSCNNATNNEADYPKNEENLSMSSKDKESEKEDLQKFVKEAISDGMMEIQMAEIAMQRSENPEIDEIAKKIKSDHEKANKELKDWATSNNWAVPSTMMEKHQEKVQKLQEMDAEDFDEDYLEMMMKGHDKAISKFKDASEKTLNMTQSGMKDLHTWIDKTIPVLEQHKTHTKNLEERVDG